MDFTEQTIMLREFCNGVLFLSAVMLIVIFARYIIHECGLSGWHNCHKDIAVQAAAAIVILMCGHAVRAGSSWMEFFWERHEWPGGWWSKNTLWVFLTATALTLTGKMLITYAFVPWRYRWHLVAFVATVSIAVPLVVLMVL
jgi:ABC-type glycerol-3-phosphate transport system permease component